MRKFSFDNEVREFNDQELDAIKWVMRAVTATVKGNMADAIQAARNKALTWRDVARLLGIADGWQEAAELMEEFEEMLEPEPTQIGNKIGF